MNAYIFLLYNTTQLSFCIFFTIDLSEPLNKDPECAKNENYEMPRKTEASMSWWSRRILAALEYCVHRQLKTAPKPLLLNIKLQAHEKNLRSFNKFAFF